VCEQNFHLLTEKPMRTFIAIELPAQIKDYLASLQKELKKSGADVKWVEPVNIHITMKFLGEIDEVQFERISLIMDQVSENIKYFIARLGTLGAFPNISSPRVIWMGLDKGHTELKTLAKELEEKIKKLGIPKEDRVFSSHITLGRTRSGLNMGKLITALQITSKPETQTQTLEFPVTSITLFKSTLSSKGPTYEAIKTSNLKTD